MKHGYICKNMLCVSWGYCGHSFPHEKGLPQEGAWVCNIKVPAPHCICVPIEQWRRMQSLRCRNCGAPTAMYSQCDHCKSWNGNADVDRKYEELKMKIEMGDS